MASAPRKVIITVVPFEQMKDYSVARFRANKAAVDAGLPFPGSLIGFATHELLWKALPPKRFDLLRAMAGQEPMSIRAVARRVGRDVKAVHGDVQLLLGKGILKKTEEGLVVFPYDEIHLDVVMLPLDGKAGAVAPPSVAA